MFRKLLTLFLLCSSMFIRPTLEAASTDPREFFASAPEEKCCFYCSPKPMRVIHETENFRIFIDTYPIISGHIMLSAKRHVPAMAALSREEIRELAELKNKISLIFNELFDGILFYEHGRECLCDTEVSAEHTCDHFHLHCVPATVCVHLEIQSLLPQFYAVKAFDEILDLYTRHKEYLFFENSEGKAWFYPVKSKLPSHVIRTFLCNVLLVPERASWNKRKDFDEYMESFNFCKAKIEGYLNKS